MQRLKQQAGASRLDRNEIFLAAQRQLAESDLLAGAQGIADHPESIFGQIISRDDEVGLVEIDRINLAGADKVSQFKGLASLKLDCINLVIGQQDIVALLVLKALHDLVLVDGTNAGHYLFVAYRLAGWFMDLAEAGFGAGFGRRVEFNGNRD